MDRKEKISLFSLIVSTTALLFNIFINRDKIDAPFSNNWWNFLNTQVTVSLWILFVIIFSSFILLWKNRPKKSNLKIHDIHIMLMRTIGGLQAPDSNDIFQFLIGNGQQINKTRLQFHLSELIDEEFLDTWSGSYFLTQKGRKFLITGGYA